MGNSPNTRADHVAKQRKHKNLPNSKVYGSINGNVEMHDIEKYEINETPLGENLKQKDEKIKELNDRLDKAKNVIVTLSEKIEMIERKMEKYGLK